MNEIKIFENKEFGNVRALEIDNEPWFVGKDVAYALGYVDTDQAIRKHIDEIDRKVLTFKAYAKITEALWSGNDFSNKTLINESGVYSLIISSKLPDARKFKRWITREVLPSIRKTGSYNLPQDYLSALKALVVAEEERQKLAIENQAMKPKAEYFDALVDIQLRTSNCISQRFSTSSR